MARQFLTDIELGEQRELRFEDADSSAYVGFKAPAAVTTNRIWTLPATDGTSSQVLSTNGSGVLSWATAGGGGGLTHFVESEETASPNAVIPVDALTATDASYTNIDVALVAKGTGATLAQVPDSTATGGNKRGTYATDLQKIRSTAVQVASGNYSTIAGGQRNTASGAYSAIGGGYSNTASGSGATVAGGEVNTASGSVYPTIAGGTGNTASSNYSFVGGGQSNEAKTNTHATCVGGISNDATGQYSFVGGGASNIASSQYSFVGGGQSNEAKTNPHATCVGGISNDATGNYSFVGGGQSNIASSSSASVLSGRDNTVSGSYSSVASGRSNTAFGSYSCISGGRNNTASGEYSFISGGFYGTTRSIIGYHVFPACSAPIAANPGVTQSALLLLGRETTDATPTVLCSNSSAAITTNQVLLPNNSAYSFSGEVIAGVTAAGDTARWTIDGAIKRGANATSLAMVGTPTVTMTHNDAGAAAWSVAVTADPTKGGIKVEVTGAAATTIRWVCKINTTEMTY
jgi:hypothetical protein